MLLLVSTVSTLLSQYLAPSLAMVLPPARDSDLFLLDNSDSVLGLGEEESRQPSGEEILDALLTQLEYPEESESIYNSLTGISKKDEENLENQLSFLRDISEEPDIADRKHLEAGVRTQDSSLEKRRKRSVPVPPFINSEKVIH